MYLIIRKYFFQIEFLLSSSFILYIYKYLSIFFFISKFTIIIILFFLKLNKKKIIFIIVIIILIIILNYQTKSTK